MQNFLDRFKPGAGKKNNNPLGNLRLPGQNPTFGGTGQSLGGRLPGKVIQVELSDAGQLGLGVERARTENPGTAIVSKVVPGSQAERANLQLGDILCFAGSGGHQGIPYDMFLELAKSDQRPLCFEVRRVQTKATSTATSKSAEAYAQRQAVIAAAEAREKANKQKQKPVKKVSSLDRPRPDEGQATVPEEPKSQVARDAVHMAKQNEAVTAAALGYNPYETNRVTAGQARNATVAVNHGTIQADSQSTATAEPELPRVRPPANVLEEAKEKIEPSLEFQQAFETLVTSSHDHANVTSSICIMRKLVANATTKGQAAGEETAVKFRRVRLANPKIKAAVIDLEGALDLMLVMGFQISEEDGESILVYPPATTGPDWLSSALDQMEAYEKS